MSQFPASGTLTGFAQLEDVRIWAVLPQAALQALEARTGVLQDSIRNLALLPSNVLSDAAAAAQAPEGNPLVDRQVTPVEAAQAVLLGRVARKHAFLVGGGTETNFSDVDPFAPAPVPVPQSAPTTTAGQSPVKRKLKVSAIMDQGVDTEIGGPEAADLAG